MTLYNLHEIIMNIWKLNIQSSYRKIRKLVNRKVNVLIGLYITISNVKSTRYVIMIKIVYILLCGGNLVYLCGYVITDNHLNILKLFDCSSMVITG